MDRTFDAERLDVSELAARMPQGSSLSINTIRKSDIKRLAGLDKLPLVFLGLRWLSASDLTSIPLPTSIKGLRIWHSNKLKSLKGIEVASELEELDLRGNGLLEDATALRTLLNLRTLSIEGDQASQQKVATLEFLEGLPIRHLSLQAVDGAALDLGPVARLAALETLELSGLNFQAPELAKVAAAHPWFYEQLMDLPDCKINGMRCKKCSGPQKELFLRSKKSLWCPVCSETSLKKVLDSFSDLVAAAQP